MPVDFGLLVTISYGASVYFPRVILSVSNRASSSALGQGSPVESKLRDFRLENSISSFNFASN